MQNHADCEKKVVFFRGKFKIHGGHKPCGYYKKKVDLRMSIPIKIKRIVFFEIFLALVNLKIV